MRASALVAVAVMALSARARAQVDPDFPRPDSPGKVRAADPPEPPKQDSRGDAPADVAHLALGAGGHFGFGIAPALAAGVQISAELSTFRWSLGLEGRYDLPASGDPSTGTHARTSLAGAAFVPCARAGALWACGVLLLSQVSSSGTTDDGGRAKDSWFVLGLGARMALHFALKHDFALRFVGEMLVHPIPWSLEGDGRTIYKSSVVSATIGPALVHAF